MFWLVQNNLYCERGYERIITTLERLKVEHMIVKPIPFTSYIVPVDFDKKEVTEDDNIEIDSNQLIMVCGAITLARIAKERNWKPGSFLNDNFTYEKWSEGFGEENVLNSDAVVTPLKDAVCNSDFVFVRPTEDSKAFTGTVMTKDDFVKWQYDLSHIEKVEYAPLYKNTEIMVSSVKEIYTEYRFFVVDKKVITGSLYKRGNVVIYDSMVDDRIYEFAQSMVDKWQPARAFVIDIAETPNGLKVIEMGNINSAGFYDIDIAKFIMAIEGMIF